MHWRTMGVGRIGRVGSNQPSRCPFPQSSVCMWSDRPDSLSGSMSDHPRILRMSRRRPRTGWSLSSLPTGWSAVRGSGPSGCGRPVLLFYWYLCVSWRPPTEDGEKSGVDSPPRRKSLQEASKSRFIKHIMCRMQAVSTGGIYATQLL